VTCAGVESRISESGELQIRSPGNMVGYYKAPDLTAECYTEDGFFKTGDRGEYSPEGLLRITGRVKELFKTSKGKYVAPVPIENLINTHHLVEISCVSGPGRPACHALVQLSEDVRHKLDDPSFRDETSAELEDLLRSVNEQIEEFESLQFVAVVREPWDISNNFLTPTLKIKRDVVEGAYSNQLDRWYDSRQRVIWPD
jgi:long-subunit acyl-CoA synthetase (AMP-forming)